MDNTTPLQLPFLLPVQITSQRTDVAPAFPGRYRNGLNPANAEQKFAVPYQ